MRKLVKTYRIVFLANLFVLTFYILILITPDLFGIDVYQANSTGLSFFDLVKSATHQFVAWNSRIGEFIFYIIGGLPLWVQYLLAGIRYLLFLNLIFIFIHGKKAKDNLTTIKYPFTIITAHLLTITLYPGFSETMIWLAGISNYIISMNLLLALAVNYRLMLDGVDLFKQHHFLKYLYYPLAFFASFTIETISPCFLIYMTTVLYLKKFKHRKNIKDFIRKNYENLIQLLLFSIGLVIMYFMSITRQDYFSAMSSDFKMMEALRTVVQNYLPLIGIIIALLTIRLINRRGAMRDIICKYNWHYFHILLSIMSFAILFLVSTYFPARVTIYFYFALIILIFALINDLVKAKKTYGILTAASCILAIIASIAIRHDYELFKSFNKYRMDLIIEQYNNGTQNIYCPIYHNARKHPLSYRLYSYEYSFCDPAYIKAILKDNNIDIHL